MQISEEQIDRFHQAVATLSFGKFCLIITMALIWLWAGFYIPKENRALDNQGIITTGVVFDKKMKSSRKGRKQPYIYYEYSYEDKTSKPLKRNAPSALIVDRDRQRVSRDAYENINIGDEVDVTYVVKTYSNQSRIMPPMISNLVWYCFSGIAILILMFAVFLAAVRGGYILKRAVD